MRAAVAAAFRDFTARFEGVCPWLYLDVLGLVTTGIGNLVDPMPAALSLPWRQPDGSLADQDTIAAAWRTVKAAQSMKLGGGGAFARLTTIRLTDAGVNDLVQGRLRANDAALSKRFPGYDSWPADAQLGTLSMAWAMGTGFMFPKFEAAVHALDFATAARECAISTAGNPGVAPRNAADVICFTNAAQALAQRLDPEKLWYPAVIAPSERATEPELPPAA